MPQKIEIKEEIEIPKDVDISIDNNIVQVKEKKDLFPKHYHIRRLK